MRSALPIAALLAALAAGGATADPRFLLGDSYPMETSVNFHAALLHWLDSLAGLEGPGATAGKTVEAHRLEYTRRFGALTDADRLALERFATTRRRTAASAPGDPWALTLAFFESPSMAEALAASASIVGRENAENLGAALDHFAPRYRQVWNDAAIPQAFLARSEAGALRGAVATFLVGVARFYGVPPAQAPAPRVHLMPVIDGHGTHAQAIGRHLLIEIRDGETLADEVAPVVHENAHLLFHRMPASRIEALRRDVAAGGPRAEEAWRALSEALPTAIAQGVAAQRMQPKTWSKRRPWYHRREIDRFAKAIFPLVRDALAEGTTFDGPFLAQALAAFGG